MNVGETMADATPELKTASAQVFSNSETAMAWRSGGQHALYQDIPYSQKGVRYLVQDVLRCHSDTIIRFASGPVLPPQAERGQAAH